MAGRRRQGAHRLLSYCVAAGVLGTLLAGAAASAASGTAQAAVFACVLVVTGILAGLAYDQGPLNPKRLMNRGRRCR